MAKPDKALLDRAAELMKQGVTRDEIKKETGLSNHSLAKLRAQLGLPPTTFMLDESGEPLYLKAQRLYLQGYRPFELEEKLGVSHSTMTKWLRRIRMEQQAETARLAYESQSTVPLPEHAYDGSWINDGLIRQPTEKIGGFTAHLKSLRRKASA